MIKWLGAVEAVEIKVAIAALWLALVGLAAIGVDRLVPQGSELVRKVVHIGTGNIVLLAWWMKIPGWIGVSAGVFFAIVTLASYKFQLLPRIDNVGRKSFGTFFYAMSIAVLVGWFWGINRPEFGVLGILIMTWGDGLAGLVGKRFGRHRYQFLGMEKSWEGSVTMAIVATFVTALVLNNVVSSAGQLTTVAFTVGILSALLEAFSNLGIDNLTVPILSATIAFTLVSII